MGIGRRKSAISLCLLGAKDKAAGIELGVDQWTYDSSFTSFPEHSKGVV